jgi:uncharacterized protein YqgV (UPF0045/DUF77 family)
MIYVHIFIIAIITAMLTSTEASFNISNIMTFIKQIGGNFSKRCTRFETSIKILTERDIIEESLWNLSDFDTSMEHMFTISYIRGEL